MSGAEPAWLRRRWELGGAPVDPLERRAAGVDRRALADLVAWGFPSAGASPALGVGLRRQAWILRDPPGIPADPDARADRLWALLGDAVENARRGRVGVALSGGLDSRAIAACAADRLGPDALVALTFGDPDCADLPIAREVARRLDLGHELVELPPDGALRAEARVWVATDGLGGPACAPGAPTDEAWAGFDVLLSGTSGDVVWGDTPTPGPAPARWLRRLGLPAARSPVAPPPPPWCRSPDAWTNLWTRQRLRTWAGARSRLPFTAVQPIPWSPPLLAFCLALPPGDRVDRALLRRALARHAPAVAGLPTVRGRVHDLGRAWVTEPAWRRELERWLGERSSLDAFGRLGIRVRPIRRWYRQLVQGRRDRSGLLSRVRAAWRWGLEP